MTDVSASPEDVVNELLTKAQDHGALGIAEPDRIQFLQIGAGMWLYRVLDAEGDVSSREITVEVAGEASMASSLESNATSAEDHR